MFIPENYDKVTASNYIKPSEFNEGANKFRFMCEPITGYMYWMDTNGVVVTRNERAGEGGKPVRAASYESFDIEAYANMQAFAAAVVWNYDLSKLQILEIKQATILKPLDALAMSKSWGDITGYDVLLIKNKTGSQPKDVEYSVMPEPKSEAPKEAIKAYESADINLKALYEGEDPFKGGGETIENIDIDFDEVMKDK